MIILVFFTDAGVPKLGLTPDIWIDDITAIGAPVNVVNGVAMTEISRGFYGYDFSNDNFKKYQVFVDGGVTLQNIERYHYGMIDEANDIELISKVEKGRWRILNNQMIFYDDDDTTPLLTFDLKDSGGAPTETEPYERDPV